MLYVRKMVLNASRSVKAIPRGIIISPQMFQMLTMQMLLHWEDEHVDSQEGNGLAKLVLFVQRQPLTEEQCVKFIAVQRALLMYMIYLFHPEFLTY